MIYKSLLISTLIVSSSYSLKLDDTPKNSSEKLSLKTVIQLSLKNDPWLLGNQYSQESIELKSISAGTFNDPKVSINAANIPTDTLDLNQEGMTQLKIGVSQVFPRGDTLEIKQEQLRLKASQYPFQRENRKGILSVNVTQLWLDAYKAQESITLIQNNRSLFEQLVDIVESSYSSAIGKTRQQDIVRAQLELTKLDDRLTKLKQKKETQLFSLSQWIYNISEDSQLESILLKSSDLLLSQQFPNINSINPENYNNTSESQFLLDSFKNHPAIKDIEQNIKAVSKEISLAKQQYKPQFGVNSSYAYRDNDLKGADRANLFSLGVTFDIPIFTKNRQDKDLQSAILKTKAIKTQKLLHLKYFITSFEKTQTIIKNLKERENLYFSKLMPQISEQAESSLTAYTNDDGDFAEVVRSRISELNAKIDLLNIRVDIQKNIMKLNYLFMTKSDDLLKTIQFKGDK